MSKRFVEGHDENIGKGEHANMPKDVYMKAYPDDRMGDTVMIDDSMTDIDSIASDSAKHRNRNVSYQK